LSVWHLRRDDSIVMMRPFLVCAGVLMLAACTSTHTSPAPAPSTATPVMPSTPTTPENTTTLGQPGCTPPSRGAGFPEVEGSSSEVQLWGLIMADGPDNPLRVNEQVKIVWRITGSGGLRRPASRPMDKPIRSSGDLPRISAAPIAAPVRNGAPATC
jgi:hypothetical protein